MLGGWSGSTGCLSCLPGSSPLPLPPLHSSPDSLSFLLDCPPASLSSPSSLPFCLCRPPYLCIIPRPPPLPLWFNAPSQLPPSVLSDIPIYPLPAPPPPPISARPPLSLSPGCPGSPGSSQARGSPLLPSLPGGWERSYFCLLWVFLRSSPQISSQGRSLGRWQDLVSSAGLTGREAQLQSTSSF